MDATTKYRNQNSKKKIVKFNLKRTIIIVIIVLLFLIGLGVGLYFALRKNLPDIDGVESVSSKEAAELVYDSKGTDQKMGLFFSARDNSSSNELLYDIADVLPNKDSEIYDQDNAEGVFAEYARTTNMPWYIIESETSLEASDNINNFFLEDAVLNTNNIDNIEDIQPGISNHSGASFIGELINSSINGYEESIQTSSITFEVNAENEIFVNTNISTSTTDPEGGDETTESSTGFSAPMLMWFENGELQFFTIGSGTNNTPDDGTEPTYNAPTIDVFNKLEVAYDELGKQI